MDFSVPLTSREGKRSALSIFNAPAYLMPPLESLFEPLIGSFLHLRTEVLDPSESRRNDAEDEDVQMDVDQDANPEEKPLLVGTRAERIVDGREMNDFVELFKHYGLTCEHCFAFLLIFEANTFLPRQLLHHSETTSLIRIQMVSTNGTVLPNMLQMASRRRLFINPTGRHLPRRLKKWTSSPLLHRQRRSVKREKSRWEKPHKINHCSRSTLYIPPNIILLHQLLALWL